MASATKVQVSPQSDTGAWSTGITPESARTASEVLQEDLQKHHVYFNEKGFHSTFPTQGNNPCLVMEDKRRIKVGMNAMHVC